MIHKNTIFYHLTLQTAVVVPGSAGTVAASVFAQNDVAAAQTPATAPTAFAMPPQTQVPVAAEQKLAPGSVHVV